MQLTDVKYNFSSHHTPPTYPSAGWIYASFGSASGLESILNYLEKLQWILILLVDII